MGSNQRFAALLLATGALVLLAGVPAIAVSPVQKSPNPGPLNHDDCYAWHDFPDQEDHITYYSEHASEAVGSWDSEDWWATWHTGTSLDNNEFILVPSGGDADLFVYDGDCNYLASSRHYGEETDRVVVSGHQLYKVMVVQYSGAYIEYDLWHNAFGSTYVLGPVLHALGLGL